MYPLIIGLIVFFCVLLILVILAQNAKGGGLSSQFGGSAASNIIGVKKTGDLLEKLTWTFIIAIIVLSLSTAFIAPSNQAPTDSILERAGQQAPITTPDFNLDNTPTEESTDSAGNQ